MATERFYPATLENQKDILKALRAAPITTHPVYYHRKIVEGETVKLIWIDPNDVEIDLVKFAEWEKTIIVKKLGSAPESLEDGTIVYENRVRNQHRYEDQAFVDNQPNGADWHYRAFPVATNGGVNMSAKNIFKTYDLFGFCIDHADPGEESSVTYIEGNETFRPASMNFETGVFDYGDWATAWFIQNLKPCMLKNDGTVDYYLDPNDYTKKADGTPSDVANLEYEGNAMMEWGKPVFYRAVTEDTRLFVYIASEKVDDSFECFSALKPDGTYGKFYLPIYEGTYTNPDNSTAYAKNKTKMRSISTGFTPNRIHALVGGANAIYNSTSETEHDAAVTNDTATNSGWGVTRWADEELIRILGVLMFKRLNFQAALNQTFTTHGSALQIPCGSANDKGLFWGHEDGSWTGFKFFGMENWWNHRNRRCTGIVVIDGEPFVKMTKHRLDGSMGDDWVYGTNVTQYKNAYMATGEQVSPGLITATHGKTQFDKQKKWSLVFSPEEAGTGSTTTHYCDQSYTAMGLMGVLLGGSLYFGASAGLFYFASSLAPSAANWIYGASLSYRNF